MNMRYLFLCMLYTVNSFSAPGDLDTTFGTSGIVISDVGRFDVITSVTLQANNKIVVAGFGTTVTPKIVVARYATDGTIDTTFNNSGVLKLSMSSRSEANATAIQADQKIVVGGFSYDTQTNFALARFNTDGSLDTTFNSSGTVSTSTGVGAAVNSIGMQGNSIIAAGVAVEDLGRFALARYTSTGTLDTTFGGSGITFTKIGLQASIKDIAIQSDNKIVAAGYGIDGSVIFCAVARYNSDGSLDTGFGTSGIMTATAGIDTRAQAVALQTDGKIVVAGFNTIAGISNFVVARCTSSGVLDASFNSNGIVTTLVQNSSQANAVAIQSDGKIVVGGYSMGDTANQFALVRYNTDGTLDTSFGTNGIVVTTIGDDAAINSLVIQSDGKIVAAGSSDGSFALARYLSS